MPVPTVITDLSATESLNSPAGTETAKGKVDDYLRIHAAFIRQLQDKKMAGAVVSSITALKAVDKTKVSDVLVSGYYAAGDGGGGYYYYDSADTTSVDNGGSIIVATDGGRWKLAQSYPLSVKQFGARGNGVADDSTSFAAALAVGKRVYVPAGTYLTDTERLNSTSNGIVLFGDGAVSIIKPKASATYGIQIEGTSGVSNIDKFAVRDLKVDMSLMSNVATVAGIYQRRAYNGQVDNVVVTGWGSTNKALILKEGAYTTEYSNCNFGANGSRIEISGASSVDQVVAITFNNCDGCFISVDWGLNILIMGGAYQSSGGTGTFLTLDRARVNVYSTDIEGFSKYFSATANTHTFNSIDNGFSGLVGTYPYNAGSTLPTFYRFADLQGNRPKGNVGVGQQTMGITVGSGSAALDISTLNYSVSDEGYVTFNGLLRVNSVSAASGAVTITGLPVAASSGNPGFSAVTVAANGLAAGATGSIVGFVNPGATTFSLQMFSAGSRSDIGALLQNNCTFIVSGRYCYI